MSAENVILVAPGFEEAEMIITVDVLRRLNIDITVVGIENKNIKSSHNIDIIADKLLCDIDFNKVKTVITPGGMPGSTNLRDNSSVLRLIKTVHANNGVLASICASPIVLDAAGILKGIHYTCYPGCEKEIKEGIYTGNETESDHNIITGKGPGSAFNFAAQIALALDKSELDIDNLFAAMHVC